MAKKILAFVFVGFLIIVLPFKILAAAIPPQISFGDLLNSNAPLQGQTLQKASQQSRYEQIQKFLKIIEENGKKSLSSFYGENYKISNAQNSKLADNVAGYFVTPVPSLHPKLEQILEDANKISTTELKPKEYIGEANIIPSKSSYTIAILGDSMTDTLGENLPHLTNLIKKEYPKTNFVLLNYGQGATNIEDGLFRLTNPTKYLNRDYPPLLHLQPDVIVIESFAYNHWGTSLNDLNRQWLTYGKILDSIKNYSKDIKIIMLATISPNPKTYGDGSLNWNENRKWDEALTTKAYLQNFINFAGSAGIPFADAYSPSLNSEGHGDARFIDSTDNLHPSEEGKSLIAQKLVETIKNNNLIK